MPAAPVTRSRKAQQAAATREELLAQSLALFAKRGVSNISLDDVAAAAGVTKGAIYWHFRNKDELLQAILDRIRSRWHDRVLAPVTKASNPRVRLERLFDGYAQLFGETPEVCLFLQQTLLDTQNKPCFERVAAVFEQTTAFIKRILDDGKRDGYFHKSLDSRTTASAIIGSLSGASQQCIANKHLKLRAAIDEVRAMALARVNC
jgi:TetR/AcrR family transcriptional regulator, acrAB operon repressor